MLYSIDGGESRNASDLSDFLLRDLAAAPWQNRAARALVVFRKAESGSWRPGMGVRPGEKSRLYPSSPVVGGMIGIISD